MKQIQVDASKSYTVTIGSGVLRQLATTIRTVTGAHKVCIVSDSNVWPLYGNGASENCLAFGLSVCNFVFSAGENSKNTTTYIELLNFLAANQISRSDCIVALGGGVVGDLAGFAAATYLRGIPYIQVPTSLLAMVDSSVGGKTAIDLDTGKNLCGAFYQPSAVLCDIDTLDTLPEDIFRDGCAEVMKYGILFDDHLRSNLCHNSLAFDRESVIARCVELKRDVVAQDEFDTSVRMLLNFGHTIGHAIEKCSHYSITHGKAVAMGMAAMTRSAYSSGICNEITKTTILQSIQRMGLPITCPYTAEELLACILADKKRSGDMIHLVVPRYHGMCVIRPYPVDELLSFIQAGL